MPTLAETCPFSAAWASFASKSTEKQKADLIHIKIKSKIIDQWQFSPFTKQVDIREARAEVEIVHIRELEFGETRIARCYDQLKDGRSELLNVTHIQAKPE